MPQPNPCPDAPCRHGLQLPSPLPPPLRTAAGQAAAQIFPNVPFWNIKPALHTNGVMRYRIFLNGRSYCSSDTRGGWGRAAELQPEGCGPAAAAPAPCCSAVCSTIFHPCTLNPRRLPGGTLLQNLGVSAGSC